MIKIKFGRREIIVLLFLLSISARIIGFARTPIFPDEITWMVRAKETFLALRTFNIGHINTYFNSDNAWWNINNDTQSIAVPLVTLTGPFISYLGIGQSILSRNILPDFVVARIPVIIVNSTIIILLYLLAEKLTNRKIAIISALLMSFDPVSVTYSRLILNDGLLTIFITLGLFSFLYIKNIKLSLFLSSLSLALGFMTKPHAILLPLAWIAFYIFTKNKKGIIKKFILASITSVVFILILWPESWYHPVISIFEYLIRQTKLVSNGMTIYFMGNVTANPPFYYYIYLTIARLPSIIVIGFIVFLILSVQLIIKSGFNREFLNKYSRPLALFIFSVAFFAVITISTKKSGVRYVLPLWPLIYISSTWAINNILTKFKLREIFINIIFGIMVLGSVYNYYLFNPGLDYYYNAISGGTRNVQKHVLVGLCYGAEETSDYIIKCYPQVRTFAYIGCSKPVVPYYFSGSVTADWKNSPLVAVEESYRILGYHSDVTKRFENNTKTIIVENNGAILSRIYQNDRNLTNLCGG